MAWFDTFAATVDASTTQAEVDAIVRFAPPHEYPRLLDVGCGTGRVTAPLAGRGYSVTAIDTSLDALGIARAAAPGARFVALDMTRIDALRCTFDVAIILWNSFGFGSRADDPATLAGLHCVLRPGGVLLADMYHPDWLAAHEQHGFVDARGAVIDRQVANGRCMHSIRYARGGTDSIAFNVYHPDEFARMLAMAGFEPGAGLVWWKNDDEPHDRHARYQFAAIRT